MDTSLGWSQQELNITDSLQGLYDQSKMRSLIDLMYFLWTAAYQIDAETEHHPESAADADLWVSGLSWTINLGGRDHLQAMKKTQRIF